MQFDSFGDDPRVVFETCSVESIAGVKQSAKYMLTTMVAQGLGNEAAKEEGLNTHKYPIGATLHSVSMSTSELVLHVVRMVGSANHFLYATAFVSPATFDNTVQMTGPLNSCCALC